MPLDDRKERQHRMYAHLAANDIDRWAERFLNALGESREQPGLLKGLRQLFAQRA
jgi:trehalose-6-phosphate synthase